MFSQKEKDRVRELAKRVVEIANLPITKEKRQLWRDLNSLKMQRPMVLIDQVCFSEMNFDGSLTLLCEHPIAREYEQFLLRTLFAYKNIPCDMVVEPYVTVMRKLTNYRAGGGLFSAFNFGVETVSHISEGDFEIASHSFENQIENEEDIQKIKVPKITYLKEETEDLVSDVLELVGDTIEVKLTGPVPCLRTWDTLVMWRGIENCLIDMIERPEFTHALVKKLTDAQIGVLDQLESKGLLGAPQKIVHCSGAYTDELPKEGYSEESPRAKDLWTFNLAQIFSSASKVMHEEYEINYAKEWFSRFGFGYYGCCEPLHDRIDIIRKLPNIRKISISPWANKNIAAENVGKDFVYSAKPNPAFLVNFDINVCKEELISIKKACQKNGTPLEFILKDLSTVANKPQNLFAWAKMAMKVVKS